MAQIRQQGSPTWVPLTLRRGRAKAQVLPCSQGHGHTSLCGQMARAPGCRAAETFLRPTDRAGSAWGRERDPAAAQTLEWALPSSWHLVSRQSCSGPPPILQKTSRRSIIPEHCHVPGTEPGGDNPVCPHDDTLRRAGTVDVEAGGQGSLPRPQEEVESRIWDRL